MGGFATLDGFAPDLELGFDLDDGGGLYRTQLPTRLMMHA